MTLLELVREFCGRTGLTKPTVIASARDAQVEQIVGLMNEIAEDLIERAQWQELIRETVFTSVAGESQGTLETLMPAGYVRILNETIFDRTRQLPIYGPRSAQDWQALKALPMSGPFYQYRIRGDELLVIPEMPAGHTLAFEYESNRPIYNANATPSQQYKSRFTLDDDVFLLPDVLLMKGLRWKWKEEKGLPYMESFRTYETAVAEYSGANGTKPVIKMDGTWPGIRPGIFVPAGNWDVQ